MARRVHILGASGAGTTTLAQARAARLGCPHYDVDDYFWLPSDPPFQHIRAKFLYFAFALLDRCRGSKQ